MERFDVAVVGLGALGSAAAHHLARRGVSVVAFEQFELGHVRGASHDTSRIVRTSYGAPEYVRLAVSARRDWADLEAATGERLLTTTGGVVFVAPDGPYRVEDFVTSLDAVGVDHELVDPADVRARWPQFHVGPDVATIWSADTGIAHASRTVAALQMRARADGAVLRDHTRVLGLQPDDGGVVVDTVHGRVRAGKVVLAADAWTDALLAPLGVTVPLVTMQEQVTYFAPPDPVVFGSSGFPVWIWLDHSCFYGFPTYGEPTVKAARDLSENLMAPEQRTFVPSAALLGELTDFLTATVPGSGPAVRTVTCQYAITPDRRFVLGPLDGQPDVLVALGAGHAFKFTPTIGRILAELAVDGTTSDDVSAFAAHHVAEHITPVPG